MRVTATIDPETRNPEIISVYNSTKAEVDTSIRRLQGIQHLVLVDGG